MSRPVCPIHKCDLADKHGIHGMFYGCPRWKTDRCGYTEDYVPRASLKRMMIDITSDKEFTTELKRVIIDLTADEESTVELPPQRRQSTRIRTKPKRYLL